MLDAAPHVRGAAENFSVDGFTLSAVAAPFRR
jgi:hypothetical protein